MVDYHENTSNTFLLLLETDQITYHSSLLTEIRAEKILSHIMPRPLHVSSSLSEPSSTKVKGLTTTAAAAHVR